MRIALFSDIHGKFLLPFKLVHAYAAAYGKPIDFILQCGDLGIFPDPQKLDKATLRHAERDRDELGFFDQFKTPVPAIREFLDQLNVDMIAVRGNHEDHDHLDELEQASDAARFPVDCYNRVFVCKTGAVQHLEASGISLAFAGVGRIGDRKGRTDKRFIQPYERDVLRQLKKMKEHIRILISHDVPCDMTDPGYGMEELREVLDNVIPDYHFYGHTGKPFSAVTDNNGLTLSVKIKELEFNAAGMLEEGCMLVLSCAEGQKPEMEVVTQQFLNPFTQSSWHYL